MAAPNPLAGEAPETKKGLRRRRKRFWIRGFEDYFDATLPACAARSRSITARQPLERLARCFIMQAVIFEMFGISELQRRNASPVHIDWASALKAKPEVEVAAENEAATASAKAALRTAFVKKAVIFGSHRRPAEAGPLFDGATMHWSRGTDCDDPHTAISSQFSCVPGAVLGRC